MSLNRSWYFLMKVGLHLSMMVFLLLCSCTGENTEMTFYRDVKTREVIDHETFLIRKQEVADQIPEAFKGARVEMVLYEEITRNDSIIKTYDLVVNMSDKPSKPNKVYSTIGKKLPDPVLTMVDGKELKLSDFEGKPTVVNFWFIGCAPCIQEMPVLNRFKEQFGKEVNFVSITFDDQKAVKEFEQKREFNFLKVVGAQGFIDDLGISGFPTTLFIDADGLLQRVEGGIPYVEKEGKMEIGDGASFEKHIRELL